MWDILRELVYECSRRSDWKLELQEQYSPGAHEQIGEKYPQAEAIIEPVEVATATTLRLLIILGPALIPVGTVRMYAGLLYTRYRYGRCYQHGTRLERKMQL